MANKSYSQQGEDTIIAECFERMHGADFRGRVLDIGAWDPVTFSNSALFIERGWFAVLVEPSPAPLRKLVEAYGHSPEVTVIGAAVSVEPPHLLELNVTDDAVSTSDAKSFEKWRPIGGFFGRLLVPTITIEQILHQFGGFNLVSIDAEGTSVDLACEYLRRSVPDVMCVEHDNRLVEFMAFAQSKMMLENSNDTNAILVKRK